MRKILKSDSDKSLFEEGQENQLADFAGGGYGVAIGNTRFKTNYKINQNFSVLEI